MSFVSLQKIIWDILKEEKTREGMIKRKWVQIVGKEGRKSSLPLSLKGKTLFVRVKNPLLRHRFFFFEPMIKERVNKLFGKRVIKKIVFY